VVLVTVLSCGRSGLDAFEPIALQRDGAVAGTDTRDASGTDAGARDGAAAPDGTTADGGGPPDPCGGPCASGTRCARGFFAATQVLTTGQTPDGLAAADFNGDGALDFVVANRNSTTTDIFLGLGGGRFGPSSGFEAGMFQTGLAAADFNGDGRPDIALGGTFGVASWTGAGDGTFQLAQTLPANLFTSWMTAGDFTGDGALDVAVTDFTQGQVILFEGDGRGEFVRHASVGTADEPTFVAAADFDRDGKLDLVVVDPGGDDVHLLLGTGSGTFPVVHLYGLMFDPTIAAVADFDGDGNLDVAVNDMGGIGVLLGDGAGGLRLGPRVPSASGVVWLTSADLNGDGIADLVAGIVTNGIGSGNGLVRIFVGNGDGTFRAGQTIPIGTLPQATVAADLNADGHPDLAVTDYSESTLTILLWNDGYLCQ
jgi:hypothetical protein